MDHTFTRDEGSKLKSFNEFPLGRTDLDDVTLKAATPEIITMDFHGNVVHPGLRGTEQLNPKSASTVEMDITKEQALKKLAQFIGSFQNTSTMKDSK